MAAFRTTYLILLTLLVGSGAAAGRLEAPDALAPALVGLGLPPSAWEPAAELPALPTDEPEVAAGGGAGGGGADAGAGAGPANAEGSASSTGDVGASWTSPAGSGSLAPPSEPTPEPPSVAPDAETPPTPLDGLAPADAANENPGPAADADGAPTAAPAERAAPERPPVGAAALAILAGALLGTLLVAARQVRARRKARKIDVGKARPPPRESDAPARRRPERVDGPVVPARPGTLP